MSKFKVGDIIFYYGGDPKSEYGREQEIVSINDDTYYTIFLDNGKRNMFQMTSKYEKESNIITNKILDNGVPFIWEDVI